LSKKTYWLFEGEREGEGGIVRGTTRKNVTVTVREPNWGKFPARVQTLGGEQKKKNWMPPALSPRTEKTWVHGCDEGE